MLDDSHAKGIDLYSEEAGKRLFPLLGLREGSPLFYYALLATTAAVAVMASQAVVERLFLRGWTKAQEGRAGRLVRHDSYTHNYPHCWRTDTPLIYRAMPSWYVRVSS